ncbi:hypothetical protein PAXINDRAFT_99756 [Paxillus involutus ATCC 200175]|uniref:Uncharacterized protein n=1 Tax=Paxillus involutus ATCC 200175 TaxID=664439 RepID=A0A0C9U709_PAXIN|nr:hypothetical protein PAXINDRAFT_99756 [Paxillus involutus ATCC 200175]
MYADPQFTVVLLQFQLRTSRAQACNKSLRHVGEGAFDDSDSDSDSLEGAARDRVGDSHASEVDHAEVVSVPVRPINVQHQKFELGKSGAYTSKSVVEARGPTAHDRGRRRRTQRRDEDDEASPSPVSTDEERAESQTQMPDIGLSE